MKMLAVALQEEQCLHWANRYMETLKNNVSESIIGLVGGKIKEREKSNFHDNSQYHNQFPKCCCNSR